MISESFGSIPTVCPACVISQRAAEVLTPIREDYGEDTGIVKQFPRKAVEELDAAQRRERIRELAVQQAAAEAAPRRSRPGRSLRSRARWQAWRPRTTRRPR
ncbi:hypothetical protein ACWGHD_25360 [Streptomyces xanthophaeus]